MKKEFSLNRLREAREARGFSLDDLADRLETSRQVISRYESGKATPRPETLVRLCAALNVVPEFFTLPSPVAEPAPLFFRHFKSKVTKKQLTAVRRQLLWLRDLVTTLEQFVVLPEVDIPDFQAPSDPYRISNEAIEKAAAELRRLWGFGSGIIVEVTKLVENKGCIVATGLVNHPSIDAFSLWTRGGRPLIAVNCRHVGATHGRLDVAHELGHLVLHRNVDRRFVELNPEAHKKIESQAFRFAGAFLMPEATFRKSVPYVSLDTLLMVKPQWQLSVAAMLHRAGDLGMVSGAAQKNLWINLTRRGWKQHEPFDDAIVPEEPKLLKNALTTIKQLPDVGVEALSKFLGLSTSDYERFGGLDADALSTRSIPEFNTVPRDLRSQRA